MKQRFALALLGAILIFAGASTAADAQPSERFAAGPVIAFPGEHAVTCLGNLSQVFLQITLENTLVSGFPIGDNGGVTPSEEVLGATSLTLPPLGSSPTTPNPCLDVLISAGPAGPAPQGIAIIAILIAKPEISGAAADEDLRPRHCNEVNPQPLPPQVVATLEVFRLGTDGTPSNVRVVPLRPVSSCAHPPA